MNYKHPLDIPRSKIISGLSWTGERLSYPVNAVRGDTYPVAWADDDELYVSSGDPNWAIVDGTARPVLWDEGIAKPDLYPHMGGLDVEKFTGGPEDYTIEQVNTMPGLMGPGGYGPKPTGMIAVKGSLYLAAQNLLGWKPPRHGEASQHGSDASILRSDDYGKTWTPDIQAWWPQFEEELYDRKAWKWRTPPEERTGYRDWKPMFPGALFGGPSFVQFGRNNEGALDEFVYAVSGDQWDNGSEMRLGRVHQDRILEADAWEWAVPDGEGGVSWVTELEQSRPVLAIERRLGVPEMIYMPGIGRYLLLTWGLHKDFHVEGGSELTVLEAEHPWGPFHLVHYEGIWEDVDVCPYTPRVPLKWWDDASASGYLQFSGNWYSPDVWYRSHVRKFQLHLADSSAGAK